MAIGGGSAPFSSGMGTMSRNPRSVCTCCQVTVGFKFSIGAISRDDPAS